MAEAYIYDAVRTPRGKGKANGSLHEQTSLQLATQVLEAIRDRNNLDTSKVDDVVLGCVSPIGEQGGNFRVSPCSTPATRKPSLACKSSASAHRASKPATSPPRK
jgi:acetyl-CoA acetyltransferase